jgi:hypothetical protein
VACDNPILASRMCVTAGQIVGTCLVHITKCSRQTNLNQTNHSSVQIGQYFMVE